jgi:hypothetical protein
MEIIISLLAFAFFLCIAAVQAVRRHWDNALNALLVSILSFCLSSLLIQSRQNSYYRAVLQMQGRRIKELKAETEEMKRGSLNRLPDHTARRLADPQH